MGPGLWCVWAPGLHCTRAAKGSPGAWDPRLPRAQPACRVRAPGWEGNVALLKSVVVTHVETAAGPDRGCGMCPGAGQGWAMRHG